jgi:pimeloyl-ACP methyl ester carboxylesterase
LTRRNKSPQDTARLIIALLDKLAIHCVTVIGISAGGLTALELAANYQNRVDSLILISALTKKWFAETDTTYLGAKKIFSPRFEKYTWALYRTCFRLFPKLITETMFKALSSFRPVEYTHDERKELEKMTLNFRSGEGFSNDLDQTISENILMQIKCSTLILHSDNDNQVDLSHPKHAQQNITNGRLATFNNRWGHLLWLGTDYNAPLRELTKHLGYN